MASHTSFLQKWLENTWYGKGWISTLSRWLLMPLTALYCFVSKLKSCKEECSAPLLGCPVVVVGNITVGGTGKTPLVIHVVKLLQKSGYKPAIITRGYGGKASSWPQSVTADSDTDLVGDEAVLMASRTAVPVYAGPNRVESVQKIDEEHDCDVIISDDGMQHYKLYRDIQIAVIDGKRLLGNGYCLPSGPLRERKKGLNKCDMIVVNGETPATENWYSMQVDGNILINLKTSEEKLLNAFKDEGENKQIHAVTGIGNPQRFYSTLEKHGLKLSKHDYPDHYNFQAVDLQFNDDLPIVMTEKDAVKCKSFASDKLWYLPVSAKFNGQFDKDFLAKIQSLIN